MLVLITCFLFVHTGGVNAAESLVIGSPQPIVAVAGDDVILPCSLEPSINAENMTIEWSRPDLDKYVHLYQDGRDSVRDQNPSYSYRTYLFEGELIKGNVSLKLFRVKLEDQGNYTCFISTYSRDKKAVIQLIVVAVSQPKITKLGTNNTGVVLQCEAKSWFPEPQLEWRKGPKDSEGPLLSADVTQTDKGPDGRYTVRSNVTVQKTDTNRFTCRVQLMKVNLKREAEKHVPGDIFPAESTDLSSLARWLLGLLGLVFGIVGVVGVVDVVTALLWVKRYIKFAGHGSADGSCFPGWAIGLIGVVVVVLGVVAVGFVVAVVAVGSVGSIAVIDIVCHSDIVADDFFVVGVGVGVGVIVSVIVGVIVLAMVCCQRNTPQNKTEAKVVEQVPLGTL